MCKGGASIVVRYLVRTPPLRRILEEGNLVQLLRHWQK